MSGEAKAPGKRFGSGRLQALSGRLGGEWERERRETLFLMLPVFVGVLPHVAWLPAWVSAVFCILFGWRLALLFSGRPVPGTAVRWAGALAATAAVWAHYDRLLGQEPGVAMLILFLGLKLLEVRARRDLFAVIFLTMFVLLAAFMNSQSIATAALVFTGFAGLLAAMLSLQYRSQEAPIAARLRTVAVMLLQALPLAVIVFLLFPRPAGTLWGMGLDGNRARTGLSDSMTPGAISSLGESDEIAFRVEFDGETPPPVSLYWRGPVFGAFDGRTWRALSEPVTALPMPQVRYRSGTQVAYSITQEPSARSWLFPLEMPIRTVLPPGARASLRPDLQLIASRTPADRFRYRVESGLDWQAGLNETPVSLRNWLELPAGFNPRTLELAAQWRADPAGSAQPAPGKPPEPGPGESDGATEMALVQRALAMFREQAFHYTLTPPLLGRNSVDDFLFDTRAGFCEHFAGAFVVLMRALDIPARVVTGYQGGERNPVDGWWLVRQADAHAWAEVWIAGRGWVRVDPTAAVAPERVERGQRLQAAAGFGTGIQGALPWLQGLRYGLDSIANAWNQWLLSYDRDRQRRLIEWLGGRADDWRSLAGLLAGGVALAIGVIVLWTLAPRAMRRDPLAAAWQRFCNKLAARGFTRQAHETAGDYVERIAPQLPAQRAAEARQIAALYNRLRYGRAARTERLRTDMRHLQECIRLFRP